MARRLKYRVSRSQLFTWLMIGSLVCILLPRRLTSGLDNLLARVVSPASREARDLTLTVTRQLDKNRPGQVSLQEYQKLEDKYQRTVNRVINISQELQNLRDVAGRLSGLRQRFGMERTQFILAYVCGNDASGKRQQIYLSEGSNNHIRSGQMVLGMVDDQREEGDSQDPANDIYQMAVIGRVSDPVSDDNSQVQLITDPGFRMPIVIQPNWQRKGKDWQADGIMQGQGGNKPAEVVRVEARWPVRPGDLVLANPSANYLPVKMVVGTVKSCRRDDKEVLFWNITIEPRVDLALMSKVIVVANKER